MSTMESNFLRTPGDLLASIEDRLSAGEGQHAARMLLDAISGQLLVAELSVDDWLDTLDEPARSKLVSAFAHYPCFACLNGIEPCDVCAGSGFAAVARVCGPCAGFGSKRCDFCNGSGLATYNLVPDALRVNVLASRASRAGRYLQKMLAHDIDNAGEAALVRHVQDINKLIGVVENAVVDAQQLLVSAALAPDAISQFAAMCDRAAAGGITRIRAALSRLSRIYHDRAALLASVDADNAEAQSEFYADLA